MNTQMNTIYPPPPTMPIHAHPNQQAEEDDPIVALLARLYAALTLRADRFDRAREELRDHS